MHVRGGGREGGHSHLYSYPQLDNNVILAYQAFLSFTSTNRINKKSILIGELVHSQPLKVPEDYLILALCMDSLLAGAVHTRCAPSCIILSLLFNPTLTGLSPCTFGSDDVIGAKRLQYMRSEETC